MAAYIIAHVNVEDWDAYREHMQHTPRVVAKFSGRFIARGGEMVTLEGPEETLRIVLVEFRSRAQPKAFYASDDYKQTNQSRSQCRRSSLIRFNLMSGTQANQGAHRPYSRAWAMRRIDGERGALCERLTKDYDPAWTADSYGASRDCRTNHFGIQTRIPDIVGWLQTGPHRDPLFCVNDEPAISGHLTEQTGLNRASAATGAVTLIQRFGSALNLNIHFHMLLPDGVYRKAAADGAIRFVSVRAPSADQLARLIRTIAERIGRSLERAGLLTRDMFWRRG